MHEDEVEKSEAESGRSHDDGDSRLPRGRLNWRTTCLPCLAFHPFTHPYVLFVLLVVTTCECITSQFPPYFPLLQITNTEYFAPLLTVNQHASHTVLEDIPSVNTFASLSNWLVRPVPTVTAAVRRFRERYFEDNYVIGEYTLKHFIGAHRDVEVAVKPAN